MNICIVGGCGRVGLPLGLALADANSAGNVYLYDTNDAAVNRVNRGDMPFLEDGASEVLQRVVGRTLHATTNAAVISDAAVVIVVIGTPVDEYLNPLFATFNLLFESLLDYFKSGQTVILRSTVYPGTSEKIQRFFDKHRPGVHVAFCPERIAEGKALTELVSLPQLVSAFDDAGMRMARRVFGLLTDDLVVLEPMEAELGKLFANSWRYIQFATANQYYMLAENAGLDFYRILDAITYNYPRATGFPGAGLAAGPCLFKDTMQLSAFAKNAYFLGHSAMLVNEGLPNFIVDQLKKEHDLGGKTVGILGMAFKGESDDRRSSLSYKLKKLLQFEADRVLCTDEFVVDDDDLVPLEFVLNEADLLVLAAPHKRYQTIETDRAIYDVWNFVRDGHREPIKRLARRDHLADLSATLLSDA